MRSLSAIIFAAMLLALSMSTVGQDCDSVPSHFLFTDSTDASCLIVVDSTAAFCSIATCDEIGVFDGDLCVGAAVYEGNWPLMITAWADDLETPEIDGYTSGNAMSFRIWRSEETAEQPAVATYSVGDGAFGDGAQAHLYLACCVYPETPGAPTVSDHNPCYGEEYLVSWPQAETGEAVSYRLLENDAVVYEGPDTSVSRSNVAGQYAYTVQTCGPCECSPASPSTTVSIDSLPPAPEQSSMALDSVCTRVTYCLNWSQVDGADRYEVRRGDGTWTNVGNALQYCFVQNQAGVYAHQVRACNACGCGEGSAVDSIAVIAAPPPIDSIQLDPDTVCLSEQFCLSWPDVAGAVYYEVRQGEGGWVDYGNSTQACFTHHTPGDYSYSVRAGNDCGHADSVTSRTVTVRQVPSGPPQPTVSVNPACVDDEYCLSWATVTDADRYELRENGGPWQDVGDTTSWCVSKPSMGVYAYEIRACNGCGCSGASPIREVSVRTAPSPPGVPSTTSNSVCLGEEYCLSWAPVATAITYQYSENGAAWMDLGNTTSLCLSHDTPGPYDYRIRAGNECGFSEASLSRTVVVEEAIDPPDQPVVDSNPVCVGQGYTIEWNQVGGAIRYEDRVDSGSWNPLGGLTNGFYSYSAPGERVHEVRACDDCGCSPPSDPVVVVIESAPAAPVRLEANDSVVCAQDQFCLFWDTVAGAQRYEIRDQGGLWFDLGDTTEVCITQEWIGGYNYEVRACNHCGCSDPSPVVNILVKPPPSQPAAPTTQLESVCLGEEFCLEWSVLPDVASYQLRRNNGAWIDYGDTNQACLTLNTAGEHTFELRACDECGCSASSEPLTVTVREALSPPQQLVVDRDTTCVDTEYCLSWTTVEDVESYEIRSNYGDWTPVGLDTALCVQPTQDGNYSYQVRSCGQCGCSAPGPEAAAVVIDHPSAPEIPLADADTACVGGNVCLTWPAVSGATYYQLSEVGGVWLEVGDSLRYCFSRSSPGEYSFVIRACNDCGCSDESPVKSIIFEPQPEIPGAPIAVSSPICNGSELCMQWAPVSGALYYEWQQDNGPWIDVGAETEYCLASASMGEHQYRARACAACGCGEPGPPMTIIVGTVPPQLESVEVTADPVCQGSGFCLNWPPVAGAKVYHVSVDDGPWVSVGGSRTYCDTILTLDSRSYYVRGCNDCGCGNSAPKVTVSPEARPERPSLVDCNVDGSQPVLGWTSAADADEYRIYRDGSSWMTTSDTSILVTSADGGEHSFYVCGVNDCGSGESSDTCILTLPTGIDDQFGHAGLPNEFGLDQNYPNPFNPETRIHFSLPRAALVRLEVVNMLGRTVRVLVDRSVPAGYHSVVWDGADQGGHVVSSGVYFYRMQAEDFTASRKMLLLR